MYVCCEETKTIPLSENKKTARTSNVKEQKFEASKIKVIEDVRYVCMHVCMHVVRKQILFL